MTRFIRDVKRIYSEGAREYYFIEHILQITNNTKKFQHRNLGGSSHESMINKVISDYFIGDKFCILDNSNRAKGQIPLLMNNTDLLTRADSENINLVISINQFDDEIIDFVGIPQIKNKNAKDSIDKYLSDNNLSWQDFVKSKIKNKSYLRDNLNKIGNGDLKKLLSAILNSYKEDNYK